MLTHHEVVPFEKIRRVRRCGLVRVGTALLEEVCHRGWTLGFQNQVRPSLSVSLTNTLSVCLSVCLSVHLSACLSVSQPEDQDVVLSYYSNAMLAAMFLAMIMD